MFWIILTSLLFVFWCIFLIKEQEQEWGEAEVSIQGSCLVLSLVILIIFILLGLFDYPILLKQRETVIAYEKNLIYIKEAYYKTTISKNSIINGNIENIKQSTNLSEYIKNWTKLKANYNSKLVSCKFFIKSNLWWWFGDGLFMSDKILELDKL